MKFPLVAISALLPMFLASAALTASRSLSPHLDFARISDDIGAAGDVETRMVFTSRDEYEAYFGHRAPVGVDWSSEWVVFYSAGVKPSSGYDAHILDIQLTEAGHSLLITTQLVSPGPNCLVATVLTKPYSLAKFAIPTRQLNVVRFQRLDVAMDCAP